MIHRAFHMCSLASLVLILISTGCYHPYPHQQPYGYTQPGYVPGQTFSPQGAPGQLIIPPSNAPLYQPGTNNDYDNDQSSPSTFEDGFQRSDDSGSDGRFFPEDGGVPLPKEHYESDRDYKGTSLERSRNNTVARTVSASQSYGY